MGHQEISGNKLVKKQSSDISFKWVIKASIYQEKTNILHNWLLLPDATPHLRPAFTLPPHHRPHLITATCPALLTCHNLITPVQPSLSCSVHFIASCVPSKSTTLLHNFATLFKLNFCNFFQTFIYLQRNINPFYFAPSFHKTNTYTTSAFFTHTSMTHTKNKHTVCVCILYIHTHTVCLFFVCVIDVCVKKALVVYVFVL